MTVTTKINPRKKLQKIKRRSEMRADIGIDFDWIIEDNGCLNVEVKLESSEQTLGSFGLLDDTFLLALEEDLGSYLDGDMEEEDLSEWIALKNRMQTLATQIEDNINVSIWARNRRGVE
jgi:hypothetical protein